MTKESRARKDGSKTAAPAQPQIPTSVLNIPRALDAAERLTRLLRDPDLENGEWNLYLATAYVDLQHALEGSTPAPGRAGQQPPIAPAPQAAPAGPGGLNVIIQNGATGEEMDRGPLPAELNRRLLDAADRGGYRPAEFVIEAIEQKLGRGQADPALQLGEVFGQADQLSFQYDKASALMCGLLNYLEFLGHSTPDENHDQRVAGFSALIHDAEDSFRENHQALMGRIKTARHCVPQLSR